MQATATKTRNTTKGSIRIQKPPQEKYTELPMADEL